MYFIALLNLNMENEHTKISVFDKEGTLLVNGNAKAIYDITSCLFREAYITVIDFNYEYDFIKVSLDLKVIK